MSKLAIWNEDTMRAMVTATTGIRNPFGGNPDIDAAVFAWDAWQRNQLPEDDPSFLPAAVADAARAAFVTQCPPPLPQYAGGGGPGVCRPSEADTRSLQALRAPIQGVSVSYAVIHFAEKAGISNEEAEAVLAYMKPNDGHRTNALLAEQTFVRFAKSKGITVTGAIVTMREWANGRE